MHKNLPAVVMPSLIAEGLQEFSIALDLTAEELFRVGIESFNGSLMLAVRAGVAFMATQESLKLTECDMSHSPTFIDWIDSRGLTKERVYEAIRLSKGYLAIPAEQRKSYLAIGKYKAIKLAKLEPEALAALAEREPGAIDEISLMSRPELLKRLENLSRNFDTVNNQKKSLEDEVAKLRPRTLAPGAAEFDVRTFEVRHESAGLEYGARIQIDALDALFQSVLDDNHALIPVDPETESLRLKAIGLAAGAVLARALDLYERVKEGLGGEMPVTPHGDLLLGSDEKAMLHAGVSLLNANFERTRDDRAHAQTLESEKHRTGPGRRKGSKNKASES